MAKRKSEQLASGITGTTELWYDENEKIRYIQKSDLGSRFIDFISNSTEEKIGEIARL